MENKRSKQSMNSMTPPPPPKAEKHLSLSYLFVRRKFIWKIDLNIVALLIFLTLGLIGNPDEVFDSNEDTRPIYKMVQLLHFTSFQSNLLIGKPNYCRIMKEAHPLLGKCNMINI